tara:strand:+ start:599 stop:1012 length:414 start_codon:yes stop_codon:yes gene_type:complete
MNKRIFIFVIMSFIFSQDKIYFIYNAENDFFSIMGDFFHKSFSPKTYPCSLCGLTYGVAFKKKIWKEYIDSLEYGHRFIYSNQLDEFKGDVGKLPVVLFGDKMQYQILVSSDEMKQMVDLEELIHKINFKLSLMENE